MIFGSCVVVTLGLRPSRDGLRRPSLHGMSRGKRTPTPLPANPSPLRGTQMSEFRGVRSS